MCIPFEVARASAWSDESSSASFLELLAPDGSIDFANPLIRSMPISVLAVAVAEEAMRKRTDGWARCASEAPRSDLFSHVIEGEAP